MQFRVPLGPGRFHVVVLVLNEIKLTKPVPAILIAKAIRGRYKRKRKRTFLEAM